MRGLGVIAVGALALGACVPGYVKDNDSPVLLLIAAINGGNTLTSDVGVELSDAVAVNLAVRPKNPNAGPIPSIPLAVILDQYSVRFFRTDGRDVEGVDVPFHFSSAMAGAIDVAISGTSAFLIPIVRAQAKQEPPLRNLRNLTAPPATPTTGRVITPVVDMIAEITIYGHTIAGEKVSATGRVTVQFVDLP